MKKYLALTIALLLCLTLASPIALAYDGEIIDLIADSDIDPFAWNPETDAVAAFIRDKFGLNLYQSETNFYNNDVNVLQLAAADGTLPDVFAADILYYPEEITQFIPQELVAEIPQSLIDKYPLTKALLESDEVSQIVHNMYGGYYFLPKPDSADPSIYLAERKGIFIRTDWLEAVGMDMPTSWEELFDVAHAFTYGDPDGNGVKDTFALTGDGMGTLRYFFSSTGVSNRYWYEDEKGDWFFGALDDRNIEVLEWLRKMYVDGSLDPDFGAIKWRDGLAKFSSNTFGMAVRNADADWINHVMTEYYGAANPDVNPFDRVGLIGALGTNKGDTPKMDAYVSCMVATMFSPSISEEGLDRFLSYFEYLLTPEGQLLRMGLEGVDWEREPSGDIKIIRDENGNAPVLVTKYPCITTTHWASWGFELQAYQNVEFYDQYNDEIKALNAEICAIRNANPVPLRVEPLLIEDTTVTDLQSMNFSAEYWQIVIGSEPVADMFAALKDKAMASGFADATKVIKEYAEKYGW